MVSVGILTHNRVEAVVRAIRSALADDDGDLEVVVVDSASEDGTYQRLLHEFPTVRVVRLPRNLGCPGGRNHVYANCRGEIIVNLDDDGFLEQGWLPAVRSVFAEDERIGIVAFRQRFAGEDVWGRAMSKEREDVANFHGGVCAFRASMLREVGLYPEDLVVLGEEAFLAIRALSSGYRIVSEPSIVMWHPRVGGTAERSNDYFRFRNYLLVVTRVFPGLLMWKYLLLRLGSYFLLAIRRGTVVPYIRAVWDVVSGLPRTLVRRAPADADAVRRYLVFRARGEVCG